LPGFAFSGETSQKGWHPRRIAEAFADLMADLGYERYGLQGGDWGSAISTAMAVKRPERVIGVHVNMILGFPPDPSDPLKGLNEAERKAQAWKAEYNQHETGYIAIQGTKPQSLAYGLTDSPAGLAAWIVEKFKRWSDCGDDVERSFTKDQLLENIMLYWVTGTINSAMRLYYEAHGPGRSTGNFFAAGVQVPAGLANYPAEIAPTPRLWAEQVYKNIVRWSDMPKGGHFAAFEQPVAFVEDLRAFARELR
jgi:microsomal epoxide hydrolase